MSGGARYKFQGSLIEVMTGFPVDSPPTTTITGITKANPAVVHFSGTAPEDGDVVLIDAVVGMTDPNGRAFIADNVGGGTFELWETDSTAWATYTSGGHVAIGEFSQFCELTNYARTSGTTPEIPVTSLCSTAQEFEGGLPDFGSTTLSFNFAPRVEPQASLHDWYLSGDPMAVRVTLPNNGGEMVQIGFVQQESEQAGVGGIWTATATIRNTGNRFDVELA